MRATRPQIKAETSARIAEQVAAFTGKTQQVESGRYARSEPATPKEHNEIQWRLKGDKA